MIVAAVAVAVMAVVPRVVGIGPIEPGPVVPDPGLIPPRRRVSVRSGSVVEVARAAAQHVAGRAAGAGRPALPGGDRRAGGAADRRTDRGARAGVAIAGNARAD